MDDPDGLQYKSQIMQKYWLDSVLPVACLLSVPPLPRPAPSRAPYDVCLMSVKRIIIRREEVRVGEAKVLFWRTYQLNILDTCCYEVKMTLSFDVVIDRMLKC